MLPSICAAILPLMLAVEPPWPPLADLQRFPPPGIRPGRAGVQPGIPGLAQAQTGHVSTPLPALADRGGRGPGRCCPCGNCWPKQGAGREEEGGEGITDLDCREALQLLCARCDPAAAQK